MFEISGTTVKGDKMSNNFYATLEKKLKQVLSESDENRQLDSLEMMMVRLTLESKGISLDAEQLPNTPTIKGWLEWLQQGR